MKIIIKGWLTELSRNCRKSGANKMNRTIKVLPMSATEKKPLE